MFLNLSTLLRSVKPITALQILQFKFIRIMKFLLFFLTLDFHLELNILGPAVQN